MAYDLGTASGTIELEYTGGRAAERAEDDMEKVERQAKDTDGALRDLGRRLGELGGGGARLAGFTALAGGLAASAFSAADLGVQIAGIVPQLVSILSLSSAIPATFVGIAAATGVLKAAFAGVGDTLAAAFDPEKAAEFQKALEKLSPAAREFAMAVKDQVPFLKELQQGLQEAFFSSSQLAGQVPRAAKALGGLQPILMSLADQFGELTLRLTNFALSADSIEFIRTSIISFREAVEAASGGMLPLLAGLRDVGTVGSELLPRLGAAVRDVATTFGEWLTEISASGQLQAWIETAITTLKTLGGILGNIGSILNSIFSAANETSGGLLQTIQELTGQFATFLQTAEGASALQELFRGISAVVAQLGPVITTLVGALAGALGPALAQIATGVGPQLLKMVEALAPAFAPLAQAIADVLVAVAPLPPPLAQLVSLLAQALAGGLSAAAAQLGPFIKLLGDTLLPILRDLGPVLQEGIVRMLPLAAQAGVQLAEAFAPLMPILVELGAALAQALIDNMPEIIAIMEQLLPLMGQFAQIMAGELGVALQQIIPLIPGLVAGLVQIVAALNQVMGFIIQVEIAFIRFGAMLRGLPGVIQGAVTGALNWLGEQLSALRTRVGEAVTGIGNFFSQLPGRIRSALAALPGIIINTISTAVNRAAFLAGAGIGLMINYVRAAPGQIRAALAALPGIIGGAVSRAWDAARTFTVNGVNAAVNFARQLPGRTRAALSALGGILLSIARTGWNNLRNQFTNGVNTARNIAATLPGRIRGALGNLGSVLVSAGRNLVMGLVNGIKGAVGAAVSAAVDVGRSVINGIKSTLKIGSPSKVMIEVGADTTEGYAIGLLNELKKVQEAAVSIAKTVMTPTLAVRGQVLNPTRGYLPVTGGKSSQPYGAGTPLPPRVGVQGEGNTYTIRIGEKAVATMVLDALTGQPVAVKHVTDEGSRRNEWAGSGR